MSSEQSVFSFELNETLYFEKGQEVAELRSISLEPEISIESFEDYISIKGVIELQGEYEKVNTISEEEHIDDLDNFDAKRYVDKVEDIGDSLVKFIHDFPVEISVPTYRVKNLEEVKVGVESFDYEFPEEGQLKLYSTIGIHGIDQESVPSRLDDTYDDSVETQEIESVEEQDEAETELEEVLEREVEDSFEFEIKEKEEESNTEMDVLSDFPMTPSLSSDDEGKSNDKNRFILKTKTQSLSEFFQNAKDDNDDADIDDEDIDEALEYDDEDAIEEMDDIDRHSNKENISYLSDMFRNSDESEYTKMRLCIVQKDDTIETIAERFEVSPLQLIKQNRLEEDFDVTEGQLLYIPYKKS